MTREPVVWGLRSKSLRCLEEVLAFKGPSTQEVANRGSAEDCGLTLIPPAKACSAMRLLLGIIDGETEMLPLSQL